MSATNKVMVAPAQQSIAPTSEIDGTGMSKERAFASGVSVNLLTDEKELWKGTFVPTRKVMTHHLDFEGRRAS